MAAVILCASTSIGGVPPLECPQGTRPESSEGPQRELRPDGSVLALGNNDAGKKHGVAHVYDEKGVDLGDMVFDHDELKSHHMTLAGLEKFTSALNERGRAKGALFAVRAIDESTLGMDFRFPDANAQIGGDRLQDFRHHVRQSFCPFFSGQTSQIRVLNVRVFNAEDRASQLDFSIKPSDCNAPPPTK